jgi:uncharacterized protein (TIGR02246 family)
LEKNVMTRTVLWAAILAAISLPAHAGDDPGVNQDEALIRKTVESYVAAFNRGDAASLAAYWCEDAEFVSPAGELFQGRQAIQKGFETFFADNSGAKLKVAITSIQIEGKESALERGTSRVTVADKVLAETQYAARYERQEGKWLLKNAREADKAPSHHEQLKELAWLIGEWVDQDDEYSVSTSCQWTKNKNFITRSFAVSGGDLVDLEGTQVIGWDADKKVIRSWLFDSDGGFGVGIWSKRGDAWTIQALRVLPDGRKGTAVNVLTPLGEDSFTLESTGRAIGGEVLPNVGPVTVVRTTSDN